MNTVLALTRRAVTPVVGRCVRQCSPISLQPLIRSITFPLSSTQFYTRRSYCSEKKPEEKNKLNNNGNTDTTATETTTNTQTAQSADNKTEGGEKKEGTENGEKKEGTENAEKKEGESGEKKEGGPEAEEEPLPPWWGSLSLTKKLVYSTLFISFISLITKLFYESALRSSLPYKRAFHIIRGVDEIEQSLGDIIEPRWFRFWEALFGYTWEESSGYQGVAKFWIPLVGVTEIKTDELDKNGEAKIKKIYKRGRAYAEAKKVGAGAIEWDVMYLVVRAPDLGLINNESNEWLDMTKEGEGRVDLVGVTKKGEMVIVDKRVALSERTDL